MDRNTLWRLGTALPLVLSCIGLTDCGQNSTTTTSLAPTAIAAKRYVEGGTFDAGFSGGAVATKIDPSEYEYALAVALQTDGKISAAGHSVLAGQGVIALVRYNADGSLDTVNFGSNGAVGTAVAVQGDGKILVAGSTFDPSTGTAGIVLARYAANGSLDTAGFAGGKGFVSAPIGPGTSVDNASLALQGDGSIVVAGATSAGDFVLRRYDSTGVLDPNFGTTGTGGTTTTHVGPSAMGPAIALQSGGKIIAAGASGSLASPPMDAVLVRYNTNGTLDTSFGRAGTGMVFTDIGSSNNFANAVAGRGARLRGFRGRYLRYRPSPLQRGRHARYGFRDERRGRHQPGGVRQRVLRRAVPGPGQQDSGVGKHRFRRCRQRRRAAVYPERRAGYHLRNGRDRHCFAHWPQRRGFGQRGAGAARPQRRRSGL